MFRPYMWAIFRLRSSFSVAATQDVWGVFWILMVGCGRGGGEILFVSIVGTMGIGGIPGGLSLVYFVHVSKWVSTVRYNTLNSCYLNRMGNNTTLTDWFL